MARARVAASRHQIATELRAVVMSLNRRLQALRFDSDLTTAQLSILSLLDRGGPASPAALATKEHVPPQSVSTVLSQLHRRGLIQRVPRAGVGRFVLVSITDDGHQVLEAEREERVRHLERAIAEGLNDQEFAKLSAAIPLLSRLIDLT